MKISVVKNFTSCILFLEYANFLLQLYMLSSVSLIGTYSTFVQRFITSEDVCWNIYNYTKRHVSESLLFPEMGLLPYALYHCDLFLLKLR